MQLSSAPNGKNHPKIMVLFCAKMRLNISSYPDFLREVSLVILLLITVISSFFVPHELIVTVKRMFFSLIKFISVFL